MVGLNNLSNGSKVNMEFALSEMEDKSGENSIIFSNNNSVETDASKFLLITGLSSVTLLIHPGFVILPIIGGILSYQVFSTISLLERKPDEVVFTKFRWGKLIMREIFSLMTLKLNLIFLFWNLDYIVINTKSLLKYFTKIKSN